MTYVEVLDGWRKGCVGKINEDYIDNEYYQVWVDFIDGAGSCYNKNQLKEITLRHYLMKR